MQDKMKRRLSQVALALVVAGYCCAPAMAANAPLKSGQWQIVTESTGTIQGTVPWITRAADKVAEADKNHVTVSIDRGSRTLSGSEGDKQFHVGDKVTVNWAIGDTEGDLDASNTATKSTVVWVRSKNQNGSDAEEISGTTGQDSYTIQAGDADYYLGIKITPTTTTGDPTTASVLLLGDLSTNAGGGADDDDIPEGPVVDENVKVVIYESGSTTNLLGTATKLKTATTYKVLLWKDKTATAVTILVKMSPATTTIAGNLPVPACSWVQLAALSTKATTTATLSFRLPMPKRKGRSTMATAAASPSATMVFRATGCLSTTNANNGQPYHSLRGMVVPRFLLSEGAKQRTLKV